MFPDIEFIPHFFLDVGVVGISHEGYDLPVGRHRGVKAVEVQPVMFQHRGDVAGQEDAGFFSSQEGRGKNVLFLKADAAFGAAGHVEDAGVDKPAFPPAEGVGAAGEDIVQNAVPHVEQFHLAVPVPREASAGQVVYGA